MAVLFYTPCYFSLSPPFPHPSSPHPLRLDQALSNSPSSSSHFFCHSKKNFLLHRLINTRQPASHKQPATIAPNRTMKEQQESSPNTPQVVSQSAVGATPTTDPRTNLAAYATAIVCSPGNDFPGCCGVVQNGQAVQGVMSNGVCQTQVQQDMYSGYGTSMPNTYLISTSGPKVQATMGGCNVRPVQSSLQNYTGLFSGCSFLNQSN